MLGEPKAHDERLVCDLYPLAIEAFAQLWVIGVTPGEIGNRQIVGPGVNVTRLTYCPTDSEMKTLELAGGGWRAALQKLVQSGCRVIDVEQMDAPEILRRLATPTTLRSASPPAEPSSSVTPGDDVAATVNRVDWPFVSRGLEGDLKWLEVNPPTPPDGQAGEGGTETQKPSEDAGQLVARFAKLIGGDGAKILAVVNHPAFSVTQKLAALGRLDERFKGYKSADLGELLGVTANAVRNSETWKEWQTNGSAS